MAGAVYDLQVPVDGRPQPVAAVLNSTVKPSNTVGVILAHGAGGDMHSGNLPQLAEAFAAAGFPCIRFTMKPPNLALRTKCFQAVLDAGRKHPNTRTVQQWVVAGHSMGARVASAVAHASSDKVCACIFLSYPLHPPNNRANLRDSPLTDLTQPLLFVRGEADNMSEPDLFQEVRSRCSSTDLQVHSIPGADHGLKISGKDGAAATREAVHAACSACVALVRRMAGDVVGGGDSPPASVATTSNGAEGDSGSLPEGSSRRARKRKQSTPRSTDQVDHENRTRQQQAAGAKAEEDLGGGLIARPAAAKRPTAKRGRRR